MEPTGKILFFGDCSLPITTALSQLLRSQQTNTLLSQFLSSCQDVLHGEVKHLPPRVRHDAFRFTSFFDFLGPRNQASRSLKVLSPALLVLVQLGNCILLAIRLGSLVFTTAGDLEEDQGEAPWSFSVDKEFIEPSELVSLIGALRLPSRKTAFITAEFERTLTAQGPPSTLASLKNILLEKVGPENPSRAGRPIPLFAPYHAPHLYKSKDVISLIESLSSEFSEPKKDKSRSHILSGSNGETYSEGGHKQVLGRAVGDILIYPIAWKALCQGAARSILKNDLSRWEIQCFGPVHNQKALANSLSTNTGLSITLSDVSSRQGGGTEGQPLNRPLAVVGMAGRFPNSKSVDELWKILSEGIDCCKVIPSDRFDPAKYVSKDGKEKNKSTTEYGNFMESPGMFDARFFNMSPREAMQTDPQQRLALVTAYEALEMAGYVPGRTSSTQMERIGTFFGQTTDDYKDVNVVQEIDTYYVSGVVRAFGPGRVSRANQFGGPSVSVDTACASSATALNLACASIWSNECDTAVVGGMMLLNSPDMYAGLSRGHFVSSDGPCKTFDDEANGYCRGEAVASVVLKRLDAATADNDNILGVIQASATNYSAYAASITQPHAGAQEKLFQIVLSQAGIQPEQVDYVELHGTGTQLGDAVEMASILNVLAPESNSGARRNLLYVGSIKANIGHAESASGISALIKCLLLFQKQQIPPHIGIKSGRINRTFPPLEQRGVRIADKLIPFPEVSGRKRRILINNFGAAGGNSSFLLAEGGSNSDSPISTSPQHDHVVSVTAKTESSFLGNLVNLIGYLDKYPNTLIEDLAYTTTARRVQHPLRVSIVASTITQAKQALRATSQRQAPKPSSKSQNLVFVFTGQGSLSSNVGKQLFESNHTFRSYLMTLEHIAIDHGFPSFVQEIVTGQGKFDKLAPVQIQLCHVAIQMALVKLWLSWNIKPSSVIGHSLGEYAALFAAGALSASDTLYLVGRRATLLQKLCTSSTHKMLAIKLPLNEVESILIDRVQGYEISCLNGPSDIVISGPTATVQEAERLLNTNGIPCTMLNVPYAFHSSQVDPILALFDREVISIPISGLRVPLLSTLLGTTLQVGDEIEPSYFTRHAREPVQLSKALSSAKEDGIITTESTFLEIGPHPVCLNMIRPTLDSRNRFISSLHRSEDSLATISKSLAVLNDQGFSLDWTEYYNAFNSAPRLLNLPSYAFDEKNYWIPYRNDWLLQRHGNNVPLSSEKASSIMTTTVQQVISSVVQGSNATVTFESDLSDPYLHKLIAGHVLNGIALCPSGVFADIALTVADHFRRHFSFPCPVSGMNVLDLDMKSPVVMPVTRPTESKMLRIVAEANLESDSVIMRMEALDNSTGASQVHATCKVVFGDSDSWSRAFNKNAYLILERIQDLESGRGTHTSQISYEMVYKLFSNVVQYDGCYQGMKEVIVDSEKLEAVVSLSLHQANDVGKFYCCPLWLDNLAQIAGFVMNAIGTVNPREFTYISHGIGSYQIAEEIDPDIPYRAHVRMFPEDKTVFVGDVSIFQGNRMIARCGDVKFKRIPRAVIERILSSSAPSQPPILHTGNATRHNKVGNIPSSGSRQQRSGSSTISSLKKLLASQIGIPEGELLDDSTFTELGVDSLLSMTILQGIQTSLNIQLPPSCFADLPTFGLFRDYVLQCLPGQSTNNMPLTPSSSSSESPISSPPTECDIPLTPSPNSKLQEIYTIIASEIGVDVEEVLAAGDLSTLGLDSMMAISILGALEDKIGILLPSDIFEPATGPNIHDLLSQMFDDSHDPSRPDNSNVSSSHSVSRRSSLPSSIILQRDGSYDKTLFLFPDGSGLASAYAKLPQISPRVRVCGLNSPILYSNCEIQLDMEVIVTMMIEVIREQQRHGPYLLGGWSAGGLYAVEATRKLLQLGEQVDILIIIDSPCPLRYPAMPPSFLDLIAGRHSLSADVRKHFLQTINVVKGYSPSPLPSTGSMQTMLIWAQEGLEKELDGYLQNTHLDYTNALVEWLVTRSGPLDALGWDELLPGTELQIRHTQGNHFNMIQDRNAGFLGAAITEALSRSGSSSQRER
ncbi:hypothetical protein N7501_005525 [Penicillium viridicatum]|nr:hypothetical protein N7501_005525 [Penicillium viridicatum]